MMKESVSKAKFKVVDVTSALRQCITSSQSSNIRPVLMRWTMSYHDGKALIVTKCTLIQLPILFITLLTNY